MKKMRKLLEWILPIAVILFLLVQRGPSWWKNIQFEGQEVTQTLEVLDLEGKPVSLPPQNAPAVLIFWATWCGPCKIELARYKDAIEDGDIPADQVYAISVGEPLPVVKDAAKERGYPFVVLADSDGQSGQIYPVSATPTTIHLNEDLTVAWASTGLNPLSIWKAQSLFDPENSTRQKSHDAGVPQ